MRWLAYADTYLHAPKEVNAGSGYATKKVTLVKEMAGLRRYFASLHLHAPKEVNAGSGYATGQN